MESRRNQECAGYRLAMVRDAHAVVAVSGFHVAENLAWRLYLYVDGLVTLPEKRSKGYGSGLLSWLKEYAAAEGCSQLYLDSGIQRKDAHRFYQHEGVEQTGFHFAEILTRE